MIPLFDRNPTRKVPLVTLILLLINVAVFLCMLFLTEAQNDIFVYRFSIVPWEIVHASQLPSYVLRGFAGGVPSKNVYLTLLTSLFLHDGWLHLGGNMLFLWIFGNNVEEVMGHLPFLGFYLLCGAFGSLAHVAVYPNTLNPLLGASGAISGVLGAYLVLYPRSWIYTLVLVLIIPVPAYVVIGFWIFLQFIYGLTSVVGGTAGVAWFAHIGGITLGLILTGILYPLLRRRRDELMLQPARDWWR
ncbi:MAG: rhomboid family intramembrane serine protease [Actinomycetota bacterium]|nr:rhomboid family intramembrane serine protease [Actinomycetota bacterium]